MFYWLVELMTVVVVIQGMSVSEGPTVIQITDPVTHAECPSWDPRNNMLYYVNVPAGTIYAYNYFTKDRTSISLEGNVSPVVQSKSDPDLFIAGVDRKIVAVKWNRNDNTFTNRTLVTVSEDLPDSNFNDGKADNQGRIWFGTMDQGADIEGHPNRGRLFKLTRDNLLEPEVMIAPVNESNGLVWNKDNTKFYYIDSPTLRIMGYDYDDISGKISNPQVVFDLAKNELWDYTPDGMTIDKDDNLWIALWGSSSVIKVNSTTGELLDRVALPTDCVSSVMWGGPDLDILFVTTSTYCTSNPAAGSVFAISNLGTKGLPVYEADIIDSI